MCEWTFCEAKTAIDLDTGLPESINKVFLDGFGLTKGWSIDGIRNTLTTSSILGLLNSQKNGIVGYAFYTVPTATLQGTHLLWEDAVCLKKDLQGRGLTSGIMERAACVFPNYSFGWIGGRTQNPLVIRRYSTLGRVFPFDAPYDTDEGKETMDFLLRHIKQASDSSEDRSLDSATGICRKAYVQGRLGDYSTIVNGTELFEKQLSDWDFQRESGDALLVVSRLSQAIQATS